MAISGAALAPNMGMASVKPLSPTLAFLNIRLGRWIRHPSTIPDEIGRIKAVRGWLSQFRSELRLIPGPWYLLREAFAKSGFGIKKAKSGFGITREDPDDHIRTGFIFLTDGGHLENLGIYELLRRHCRLILAVDAEQDPKLTFPGLVQLERLARIDLNVKIYMHWQPIADRTLAFSPDKEVRSSAGPHVALGRVDYPLVNGCPPEKGILVYIKASFTGDENDYVKAYKAAHPSFPHETTGDQFFSEEQVEVYRALGEHIARGFVMGRDEIAVAPEDYDELIAGVCELLPRVERRRKSCIIEAAK